MGRSQGSYCELFRAVSFFWNQLRENADLATSRPWQNVPHSSVFLSLLCTDPSHIPARLILLKCHINHGTPARLLTTQSVTFKTTSRCCRAHVLISDLPLQVPPGRSPSFWQTTLLNVSDSAWTFPARSICSHYSPGCKFLCRFKCYLPSCIHHWAPTVCEELCVKHPPSPEHTALNFLSLICQLVIESCDNLLCYYSPLYWSILAAITEDHRL